MRYFSFLLILGIQKILLPKPFLCWVTKNSHDSVSNFVNLILETGFLVVNNMKVWVRTPSVKQLFVSLDSIFSSLIPSFVRELIVKFSCSVGTSDHVDDSIVSPVSHPRAFVSSFLKKLLPDFRAYVSLPIHDTSVEKNDSRLILRESKVSESFFKVHLPFDDVKLESKTALISQSGSLTNTATFD